jgi:hypothetical protein
MPEADGTTTVVSRVRQPRGQRAQAQLLERPSRSQQAERIAALVETGLDSEAIVELLGPRPLDR